MVNSAHFRQQSQLDKRGHKQPPVCALHGWALFSGRGHFLITRVRKDSFWAWRSHPVWFIALLLLEVVCFSTSCTTFLLIFFFFVTGVCLVHGLCWALSSGLKTNSVPVWWLSTSSIGLNGSVNLYWYCLYVYETVFLISSLFCRIQPLHMFITFLTTGVVSLVQWGPYWFPFVNIIMDCKTYWWANMVLISNIIPVQEIVCWPDAAYQIQIRSTYLDVNFLILPLVRSVDVVPFSGLPVLPHHSTACLLLQTVCPPYTICGKHFNSGEIHFWITLFCALETKAC